MIKFPLKFFYNIRVILENLEFPQFRLDFLQKKFYNIDPRPKNLFKDLFGQVVHLNCIVWRAQSY